MDFIKYCYKLFELKSIDDILTALEQCGVGSIIIIDDHNLLIGVVTDGDIRRALLKKETEVRKIINYNPEVWLDTQVRRAGIGHMRKVHKNILPVVDNSKKVIDVLCLNEISFDTVANPVVIMAGGLGTRLYPLTKDTPKPMLLLYGKPMLERIIEKFIGQGFYKFFITINYLGEQIKEYFQDGSKWGVNIEYIEETDMRLGTAGSLYKLKNRELEPFLVINGDVITDLNFREFLDFHSKHESLATMCLYKQVHQIPFGVVEFDKNKTVISIQEKPNREYYVNMGIYAIAPNALEYIPDNEYFDMPTLFQNFIDDNKAAKVYLFDGLWNDIGHVEDYKSANKFY